MKKILFYCLLFTITNCFAQQDYIITLANDTLHGKVTRGNLERNYVRIENDLVGKKKIHLSEIKEWKNGNMPVIVLPDTTKKQTTWTELLVEMEGRTRLLRDIYFAFQSDHYIGINGRYIAITENNLANYIWSEWIKCKLFREKYKHLYQKQVGELYKQEKMAELREIINYYNSNCKTPTEPEFTFNIRVQDKKNSSEPSPVSYVLRNGYLIREKHLDVQLFPNSKRTETDSVVFKLPQWQQLKNYFVKNRDKYQDEGMCKHIPPLSAKLYFRDEEVLVRGYYGPCSSISIPKEFLEAQQYLETFFQRRK